MQVFERVVFVGVVSCILDRLDVFGACTECGDLFRLDQVPECGRAWTEGRAVKENNGGAKSETRDEPVPHHPAGGGILEENVVGGEVSVEDMFLLVLEK